MATRAWSARRWAGVALFLAAGAGCGQISSRHEPSVGAGTTAGDALLVDDDNRLLATLLGDAAAGSGSPLIGANTRWFANGRTGAPARAREAAQDAERFPTTPAEVRFAGSADIDRDGFVTMNELCAIHEAGLSEAELMQRLQATDLVFDLTPEQALQLLAAGLSAAVVRQLEGINRDQRQRILGAPPS